MQGGNLVAAGGDSGTQCAFGGVWNTSGNRWRYPIPQYHPGGAGHQPAQEAQRQCFIEVFSGLFPHKCLNENWFLSLEDAEEKMETRRNHYNGEKLHSALGNLSPRQFAVLPATGDSPAKLAL